MLRHTAIPLTLILFLVALGTATGANVGMVADSPAELDLTERHDSSELIEDAESDSVTVGTVHIRQSYEGINPTVREYFLAPLVDSVLYIADRSAHTVYWLRGWVPDTVLVPVLRVGLFGVALLPVLITVGYLIAVARHLGCGPPAL